MLVLFLLLAVADRTAPAAPPSSREQAALRLVDRATRDLEASLRRSRPLTRARIAGYLESLAPCADRALGPAAGGQRLATRREEVFFTISSFGLLEVVYDVNGAALRRYARALERVPTRNRRLRIAFRASAVEIRDPVYEPDPSVCAVIDAWAAHNYSRATQPIDSRLVLSTSPRASHIEGGYKELLRLGVPKRTSAVFRDPFLPVDREMSAAERRIIGKWVFDGQSAGGTG